MISTTSTELKPYALTDWTYHYIKEKILNLEIKPGQQINIDEFTEKLEVSRTPIREAFLKLASEGLLEVRPRVGYFVVDITEQEIRDLFEIREIVESRAAKKAASQLSEQDLEEMKDLMTESHKAVENSDFQLYLSNEIKFHGYLQKHIHNKRLTAFMDGLNDLTYRERMLSIRAIDNIKQTLVEHQRILDGLIKRDGNLAEWYMGEHLHNVSERLIKYLAENKNNI
jgi:DNA-binding GntR family transcriptional regulator